MWLVRIGVVGARGIPDVHGGVERHCEELYPRIVAAGYEVNLYARQPYVREARTYGGVSVQPVWAPAGKGVEAFAHTAMSMRRALQDDCDVLHIHSVGPCSLIPYARYVGHKRIVATLHAPDYRQQKWGYLTQMLLQFGERKAATKADAVVSVSEWYGSLLAEKYGVSTVVIPNGPGLVGSTPRRPSPYLQSLGIEPGYVLFVGRLVPDKRVEDLVAACGAAGVSLVVAGDSSDTDGYVQWLRESSGPHVSFVGYAYGQDLVDLYSNASVFVLPSAVEGLSISAIEAMSFAVPVILSDIPANREVAQGGIAGLLYPCGDIHMLEKAIRTIQDQSIRSEIVAAGIKRVHDAYEWNSIAERTIDVYKSVM